MDNTTYRPPRMHRPYPHTLLCISQFNDKPQADNSANADANATANADANADANANALRAHTAATSAAASALAVPVPTAASLEPASTPAEVYKPILPIDGLPPIVRAYIEKVCEVYHCPREFVTSAVIATAATAVGKRIKVDSGLYKNPLMLWFVVVADSGSNKTYPLKLVTAPLQKIDDRLYEEYEVELKRYKNTPEKDRPASEPRCRSMVLDDCTEERRNEILYLNSLRRTKEDKDEVKSTDYSRGAIGIYPELKGMFDSFSRYQNSGTAPISKLLRLFDGDKIKVDRKNGTTMSISDPHYNILGDLQPALLRKTFGSELFMNNGLNQRFLFCLAEDMPNPEYSEETLPTAVVNAWEKMVNTLYEGIYHTPDGNTHRTLFRAADGLVHLSPEAKDLYKQYYNTLQEKKNVVPEGHSYLKSVYGKLQIHVLRYAGVVHALEIADACGTRNDYNYISAAAMDYAIRCMAYFEAMAIKVYGILIGNGAGGTPTRAEAIRGLLAAFPQANRTALANALQLSRSYISQVCTK